MAILEGELRLASFQSRKAFLMNLLRRSLALFLFLFTASIAAQNAQLSGLVRDTSKASIANANVVLENEATHVKWEGKTNGDGLYVIPSVAPGVYTLTISAAGFEKQVANRLKVEVAGKIGHDVVLRVGSESESITVDASGLQINTIDAAVSTVVDQKFVENIPLNGRSFQSLLTAVPGVTVVPATRGQGYGGELTVNGMRTEANYYTVDGVSANTGAMSVTPGWGAGFAGSVPGQSVLGTTQSLISIEALKELRATTSTYSAEYGRTPGGQFSFVSRSGTNDWHGSVYEYFRNDVFDSNDWFTHKFHLQKPRTRQNDFGGTLGGPILIPGLYNGHDRSFFFASYEGLRLRAPQPAINTVVPGPSLRTTAPVELRQFLNAFPVPTEPEDPTTLLAPYRSPYSNPSALNATSVRVDHSLSDNLKFFARYSYAPSSTDMRSANDLANVTHLTGSVHSGTAGLTWLISQSLANDIRVNFTNTRQISNATIDTFGGAVPFSTAGLPGYTGQPTDWLDFYLAYDIQAYYATGANDINQLQFNIVDSMTFTAGRHSFKWGVDYRRIHSDQPLPPFYSFPGYESAGAVLANNPDWLGIEKFSGRVSPVYTNFSAYLQDEWKASSRLNVSAGVRWDINPAPHDANGNDPYGVNQLTDLATTVVNPRGTALWKTRYGNVSPRLGLAYRLHNNAGHETVLRAGAGTFYDMGNTSGSTGYFGLGIAAFSGGGGRPFPFAQTELDKVHVSDASPYNFSVYGFDPNLKSPYGWQWNVSLEQALGEHQTLNLSYVASQGKNLLATRLVHPELFGNNDFSNGQGLYATTNDASSNYNALQVRYQQTLRHGLQLLGAYTWSHAIDNATSNFAIDYLQRASSSNDIRHNAQVTLSYTTPGFSRGFTHALTKDWGLDSRISARSALPVDLITGINVTANGGRRSYHPNRVPGQPLYINDATAPGGRHINYNAFTPATDGLGNDIEGNIGRNYARAFNAVQTDLALRRDFPLYERLSAQFRVEAFNIFNHPIFGNVYNDMTNGPANFGYASNLQNAQLGGLNSLYQTGGPRSLQISAKLRF